MPELSRRFIAQSVRECRAYALSLRNPEIILVWNGLPLTNGRWSHFESYASLTVEKLMLNPTATDATKCSYEEKIIMQVSKLPLYHYSASPAVSKNDILESARIVCDPQAKKKWDQMTRLEVFFKICTFGLYSPSFSAAERAKMQQLMQCFEPPPGTGPGLLCQAVFPDSNHTKVTARHIFGTGTVQLEICTIDGEPEYFDLSDREAQNFINALPEGCLRLQYSANLAAKVRVSPRTVYNIQDVPGLIDTARSMPRLQSGELPDDSSINFETTYSDASRALSAKDGVHHVWFNVEVTGKILAAIRQETGLGHSNPTAIKPLDAGAVSRVFSADQAWVNGLTPAQREGLENLLTSQSGLLGICATTSQSITSSNSVLKMFSHSFDNAENNPNNLKNMKINWRGQVGYYSVNYAYALTNMQDPPQFSFTTEEITPFGCAGNTAEDNAAYIGGRAATFELPVNLSCELTPEAMREYVKPHVQTSVSVTHFDVEVY